jgi:lysyl-tRNA synthetase class 2
MIDDISTTQADRVVARQRLRARGISPYPQSFPGRRYTGDVRDLAAALAPGETVYGPSLRIAGRLVGIRRMGRIAFMDIRDRTGTIQVLLDRRVLGTTAFELALEHQRGDHLGVAGFPLRTRSGEPSLGAVEITMLSKTMIPTSDGLRDPEIRQRHREADLIANPEVGDIFYTRALIIRTIRDSMHERDFIEVETPILQPLYGGAAARPFRTHHNALDADMYLRIAPELYLKRCVAGGLERVYEIGKNFRNEGISPRHNPEFTVIEYYQAYADYIDLMVQVEQLVYRIAVAIGHPAPDRYAPPWTRIRLHEAILELTGIDILALPSAQELRREMNAREIPVGEEASWAELVDDLQGIVERTLDRPAFIIDHPVALSPLAKTHRDDPRLTERFEAFIDGMEIANAFTELNDPDEQRDRFLASRDQGEHAHPLDEDFLEALGRGMPPTAGCGIGIDRLVMLLTGAESIRDVILFPAMRPLTAPASET